MFLELRFIIWWNQRSFKDKSWLYGRKFKEPNIQSTVSLIKIHTSINVDKILFYCSGDHTESIEIHYDPKTITYEKLLNLFWNNHEYGLTTKIKKQYASIIFYHNDEQKQIAEKSRVEEQKIRTNETIITTIVPASEFYSAEE